MGRLFDVQRRFPNRKATLEFVWCNARTMSSSTGVIPGMGVNLNKRYTHGSSITRQQGRSPRSRNVLRRNETCQSQVKSKRTREKNGGTSSGALAEGVGKRLGVGDHTFRARLMLLCDFVEIQRSRLGRPLFGNCPRALRVCQLASTKIASSVAFEGFTRGGATH
jgi:hypothetical protein